VSSPSASVSVSVDTPVQSKKKPRWRAPKKVRKPRRRSPKWTPPLHWDPATGELFGARPIPPPSYPAFRAARFSETTGDWIEVKHVPAALRAWISSQKKNVHDPNAAEARKLSTIRTNRYAGYHACQDFEANLLATMKRGREYRCANCRQIPARLPEVVERVQASAAVAEDLRDRFNRDPRTLKINRFLAEQARPMPVGTSDGGRPTKPRIRETGGLLWFLADRFASEPFFRNLETPMTETERKQRSRTLASLITEQEADEASGGLLGPGRFMPEAPSKCGLPVSGGYDPTKLDLVFGAHESNAGNVKPQGNHPEHWQPSRREN
jgi:hypothetical protein